MTTFVVAFFVLTTTVDQPFQEKKTECIISALSIGLDSADLSISWSGSFSYSWTKSYEVEKRIKLCSLYNTSHKSLVDILITQQKWQMIFVAIYLWIGIIIFLKTIINDVSEHKERKNLITRKKKI